MKSLPKTALASWKPFAVILMSLTALTIGQPMPYVPYRIETNEFHKHVEREQKGALYVVQSTPAPRSILPTNEPVRLTITFSKPLDPDSIPPVSPNWTLKTPRVELNSENLSDYGTVAYYPRVSKLGDRVVPPNTLVFELQDLELSSEEFQQCELIVSAQKLDRLPTEPLTADISNSWSFRLGPPHLTALDGRVALGLEEVETSFADTSLFRELSLLRGARTDESLLLRVVDGPLPSLQPYRQRELFLKVPLSSSSDSELKLDWTDGEILYTEWDFEPSEPAQRPTSANAGRFWKAEGGELTLVEGVGEGSRLYLDLTFVSNDPNTVGRLKIKGEVEIYNWPRNQKADAIVPPPSTSSSR